MAEQQRPELPVQAAGIDWYAQMMAEQIQDVGAMVATVTTHLEEIRGTLDVARRLLGEDIDAAEILDADMLAALAPAGQAALPDVTVDAAAKLFTRVSSGAPLLPGAILAAGNLISSVFEFDHQAPELRGLLTVALIDLEIAFGFGGPYFNVVYSNVQPGDRLARSQQTARATKFATEAKARMHVVSFEAMYAAELLRSHCLVQSLERKERMRELEMTLIMAIKYVIKAIMALDNVRDTLALMDQTLRQVIGNGNVPMAMNP